MLQSSSGGVLLGAGGVSAWSRGDLLGPGGVLPARGVSLAWGGGVSLVWGMSPWSWGGICLVPGGVLLVPGGVLLGPRGVVCLVGGVLPAGGFSLPGGVSLVWGVSPWSRGVLRRPPLCTESQTRVKKHNLGHNFVAAGNYLLDTEVHSEVRGRDPDRYRDQTLDNCTGVVTPLSDKFHPHHT